MRPALAPGDEFVATGSRLPVAGEIVALPHPGRHDFWLVKRMSAGPGQAIEGNGVLAPGEAWVVSDNLAVEAADSRSFGSVPVTSLKPMVSHLDHDTFADAVQMLAGEEPSFAEVVEEHGPPPFWQRPARFSTLVWLILEQQVSLESGAAMYRRLIGLLGQVTPQTLAGSSDRDLRAIGVTRQKSAYLMALAQSIAAGRLDLDGLGRARLHEARASLLAMAGIGPWTADAYLLSALRFPDVFPLGDRALQVGTAEVLGMSSVPDEEQLEMLSAPWRPVRAAAARIIWHAYLRKRGRVEPPDPTVTHLE